MTNGRLLIGATPLGQPSDASARLVSALGSAEIVAAGGSVLVQDEASSVVWGMPGAVVAAGLAPTVLPLPQIGPAIVERVRAGRAAPVPSRAPAREVSLS